MAGAPLIERLGLLVCEIVAFNRPLSSTGGGRGGRTCAASRPKETGEESSRGSPQVLAIEVSACEVSASGAMASGTMNIDRQLDVFLFLLSEHRFRQTLWIHSRSV